jgi:hypothetical protein
VELSHDTISKITHAVAEEVKAWQHQPLDPVYSIIWIDALVVKVRDGAHVVNKAGENHPSAVNGRTIGHHDQPPHGFGTPPDGWVFPGPDALLAQTQNRDLPDTTSSASPRPAVEAPSRMRLAC